MRMSDFEERPAFKPYPDGLDSTPTDFAKYLYDSLDSKRLGNVLRKGPIKVGSFCTGAATCYIVVQACCG